jgi:hypothetical protein
MASPLRFLPPLGAMLKEKRDKLLDGAAGYEKDVRPKNKGN